MKKRFFYLLNIMLTMSMLACVVACNDDDDDDEQTPATFSDLYGHYLGDMDCEVTVKGRVVEIDYNDIVVDIVHDDILITNLLYVRDFSYQNTNYGDIRIPICISDITESDGSTLISGEGQTSLVKDGKDYLATVSLAGFYNKYADTKKADQCLLNANIIMALQVSPQMTIDFAISYRSNNKTK